MIHPRQLPSVARRLRPLFWDQRYRRLRAFWRIVLFVLTRSVLGSGLIALAAVLGLLQRAPVPVNIVASALATMVSACLCTRLIDRRSFADLGLELARANRVDFCLGLALGAVLMTLILATGLACGWLRIEGTWVSYDGPMSVIWPLILWVLVGVQEEVWVRGYLLVNLAEGLHGALSAKRALLAAWVLTSVYFGALHAFNPAATLQSTLALVLSGLLLGLGMVVFGRLGLPIGLHIAWNLFEGTVYGLPVSGLHLSPFSVFNTVDRGPTLWTGGAFGPEAGLLGILAMLAGIAAILLIARARCRGLTLATELATPPAWREVSIDH